LGVWGGLVSRPRLGGVGRVVGGGAGWVLWVSRFGGRLLGARRWGKPGVGTGSVAVASGWGSGGCGGWLRDG